MPLSWSRSSGAVRVQRIATGHIHRTTLTMFGGVPTAIWSRLGISCGPFFRPDGKLL